MLVTLGIGSGLSPVYLWAREIRPHRQRGRRVLESVVSTRFPEGWKAVLVVVPFVAVLWDISHWWLTKRDPSQARGVIFGGALMSLGFAVQWLMTMWDVRSPLGDREKAARAE